MWLYGNISYCFCKGDYQYLLSLQSRRIIPSRRSIHHVGLVLTGGWRGCPPTSTSTSTRNPRLHHHHGRCRWLGRDVRGRDWLHDRGPGHRRLTWEWLSDWGITSSSSSSICWLSGLTRSNHTTTTTTRQSGQGGTLCIGIAGLRLVWLCASRWSWTGSRLLLRLDLSNRFGGMRLLYTNSSKWELGTWWSGGTVSLVHAIVKNSSLLLQVKDSNIRDPYNNTYCLTKHPVTCTQVKKNHVLYTCTFTVWSI